MKQFILAAALISATATTALAQGTFPAPPTEQVVKTERQNMINKTTALESALSKNNTNSAEDAAFSILKMMKARVAQTRNTAEANTGASKDALMTRMLMLEGRVQAFMKDSKDVKANGSKLVAQAKTFTGDY